MSRYEAIREQAGDGTLSDVYDWGAGKVVSPYPMAWSAAIREAEFRNAEPARKRHNESVAE